jgi:putative hydrolase of the HAD superfamily
MTPSGLIKVILFDLDETLYPRSTGLMQAIGRRIQTYMEQRMGMAPELVARLRPEYVKLYGTSLRGLQLHYEVDSEDYLRYVHDVALSEFIAPNPLLRTMLAGMTRPKVIFTNATREHALNVTRILGVEDMFDRIIDVRQFDYVGKPHPSAYDSTARLLGVLPIDCLLVEDNVRNLRPAKQLGMTTVMVGDHLPETDAVDYHAPDILNVGEIVERLVGPGTQAIPGELRPANERGAA